MQLDKQGNSLVVEVQGKAAHGARPEQGINAVSIMMDNNVFIFIICSFLVYNIVGL